jgi:NlpC/P60 family putative phage cell wall peptidase
VSAVTDVRAGGTPTGPQTAPQTGAETEASDFEAGEAAAGSSPETRARALAAARDFLGTPYRHQGSRQGVGCDCLGLVRGVWRTLYGTEPEAPGPYTPDWAERADGEPLLEAAARHMPAIAVDDALPGDLLLFRWRPQAAAKHCGILDAGGRVIHAYEGHAVVSSPLGPAWRRRIAAAFRFPE